MYIFLEPAFSIIRFRSAPGGPKDIGYIFFTLGVGLACGMGYILYGVIFATILCLVMIVLAALRYGEPKTQSMHLKIVIPEDTDYQNLFDDIFRQYAQNYRLEKVKTSDFGSLFELSYSVAIKEGANQKEFIDMLRTRNSNLSIVLNMRNLEDKVYM